ncbi:TetR/AcrR family transcriptional regulator [Marinicella sp. W31]|uniref:TetR/AcrR family transcriptional regulator n=1 Tax=Marinicella sp. W31 TaxID=3023713 RepID=UPI003756A604
MPGMGKGQHTFSKIIDQAQHNASLHGISGLTIGSLANQLHMSKSGLFAHFGSKTDLQKQVVTAIFERFAEEVVMTALEKPPGRAQIELLMQNWIGWSRAEERPGGCPMASSFYDLDALELPIRQLLKSSMLKFRKVFQHMIEQAQTVDLDPHLDSKQLTTQLIGVYFSQHINHWLLDDATAAEDALVAVRQLLKPV